MRVLYFHQYFSTRSGAAGTRSYEFARRLVERGHEVLMVCGSAERSDTGVSSPFRRGKRRGQVDGIDVLEFDLGYSNRQGLVGRTSAFLHFALGGIGAALTEKCDLIFASTTPLTAGLPGIAGRWARRKRFVFEVRDLWPELPRAMGLRNPWMLGAMSALEWTSYRSATATIGLAPGIVDGIARRGVDRSRIALVPNGCDVDLFTGPAEPWRPAGVGPADLMAVFAGAHGPANGLDAVLDAAAELKRRNRRDVKLVLIGEGKLKRALEQRVAREALTNVVFCNAVSKQRLAGLMATTDIGMQILANIPAFYDGTSPNKFFDYLAAGRPVLINYPGWLADVVCEHGCGYAVPPGDPAAFAAALGEAADDRRQLAAMGRRAGELGAREFNRRALADRFVDWLEHAAQ